MKSIKFSVLLILMGLLLSIAVIPLRLLVTLYYVPQPQVILVLGGDDRRFSRAANLAQANPHLTIWVSDYPYLREYNKSLLQQAGISPDRVRFNFCATDTVTNFTCTVKNFTEQRISHVYLVTSDFHMRRAKLVATLVFGSRGIAVTPVFAPAPGAPPESSLRVVRDGIRSLIWIVTGKTGAKFNPRWHHSNFSERFLNNSCSYSSIARSKVYLF